MRVTLRCVTWRAISSSCLKRCSKSCANPDGADDVRANHLEGDTNAELVIHAWYTAPIPPAPRSRSTRYRDPKRIRLASHRCQRTRRPARSGRWVMGGRSAKANVPEAWVLRRGLIRGVWQAWQVDEPSGVSELQCGQRMDINSEPAYRRLSSTDYPPTWMPAKYRCPLSLDRPDRKSPRCGAPDPASMDRPRRAAASQRLPRAAPVR